ncbi:MAG: hypothetical protein ACLQFR_06185 [Streptosporangiaceae bacterium]
MADTTTAENVAAQFRDAAADAARIEARMKAQQQSGHAAVGLEEKCRAPGVTARLIGIWCPLTELHTAPGSSRRYATAGGISHGMDGRR